MSNHVYYVMQDSKGYLWFGTYQGVSRFDGKEFRNYSFKDGLLNNDVFIIKEDHKGRIWFASYTNALCYFENDSIYPYKFNEKIKEHFKGNSAKTSLLIQEDETIYLGDALYNMIRIDPQGNVQKFGDVKRNIFKVNNEYLTSQQRSAKRSKKSILGENMIHFFDQGLYDKTFRLSLGVSERNIDMTGNHYLVEYGPDSLIVVHGNFLLTDFGDQFEHRILKFRADDIYIDRKKRIWLGSIYNGAFAFGDPYLRNEEFHILRGNSVTHIIEDFQGGYWFTTLNNGVFHYTSIIKQEPNRDLPNAKVRNVILGNDGYKFILYDNSEVWYKREDEAGIISIFDERITKESNHIYFDDKSNTLFLKGQVIYKGDAFHVKKIPLYKKSEPRSRSYQMFEHEGILYDIRGRGIFKQENGKSVYAIGKDLEYNRVQCVQSFKDTTWLGTLNGIRYLKNGKILEYEAIKVNAKITAIGSSSSQLAFAMEGNGIIIKGENGVTKISEVDVHHSLKVFSIDLDEEGNMLIGTTLGLYHAKEKNGRWNVKKLSAQQADIRGVVTKVVFEGDHFYLGTEKGLVKLDVELLEEQVIPPLSYINLVKIDGQPVNFKSGGLLNYDKNSLEIQLTCIDYSESQDIIYAWKFDRSKDKWKETNSAIIYLDKLAPGKYKILSRSSTVPDVWSEESSLEFRIKPPFWLTWWFITFSSIGFVGAVILIIYFRGEKLKKKAAKEIALTKEKNELEMKALRAQMNPHFIFNTLTAIQFLIQTNQNKKAQHFLIKFSQLLRRVTDTSQDRRITLKEELDILQTYVDLQNLRFKDKFQFTVNIPEELDLERTLIPGLILQPFVENAIQHGLSKKEGKGKLDIDIKKDEGLLRFAIIDDGIGRLNSQKLKLGSDSERKSVGITNVSSRLDILNFENKNSDSSVSVTDLYNEQKEANGTRIDLTVKFEELKDENDQRVNLDFEE